MSPINEEPIELVLEPCEQNAITKLVKIVQIALQCSADQVIATNRSLLSASEEILAKWLVAQNETLFDVGEFSFGQNSTNSSMSNIPIASVEDNGKVHRLQHLEMIKVAVLIIVISIIMLTTCRMVFQLFVRYNPDKPQMH